MISALSIVLFAFAILLCAGGAPFAFWLVAGSLACLWQLVHTVATGYTPAASSPEEAALAEEVGGEDV